MTADCPVVVLDACVLYPASLRSLLMWLAVHGLIQPKWTEQIHDEWMRNVLKDRPDLTLKQLERTRELMDKHAGDCLVTDYERHMADLDLPDKDDRHVLAAAIECEADAVVTWNLGDFPRAMTAKHGIKIWTPDELLLDLLKRDQNLVIESMRAHRASLKHPPKAAEEYLETLKQQRLIHTVEAVQRTQEEI